MANGQIDTKAAVAEINLLITAFNELLTTIGKTDNVSKTNFKKVETGMEALKKVSIYTVNVMKGMTDAQKKLTLARVRDLEKIDRRLKLAAQAQENYRQSLIKELKAIKEAEAPYNLLLQRQRDLVKSINNIVAAQNKETSASKKLQVELDAVNAELLLVEQSTRKYGMGAKSAAIPVLLFMEAQKKAAAATREADRAARENNYTELLAKQKALTSSLRALITVTGAETDEVKELQAQLDKLNIELTDAEAKTKKYAIGAKSAATPVLLYAEAQKKLAKETAQANKEAAKFKAQQATITGGIKSLIGAFGIGSGIQIFADLLRYSFSLVKQLDGISLALKTVARDSFEVAASQRYLKDITESFGVELVSTTERYVRFLAAAKQSGVTLEDTQNIFRSMTKAGALLGLQTDDLSTVYLALEQMMSKGKVTTEELRRQLGEKLPGAVGIMAAAVGVSVDELDKLLKKGEVLSADVLPRFAKAVEAAYGIEVVENIQTVTAEQNKLTNTWERFVISVTEGSGKIGQAISFVRGLLTGILRQFTPENALIAGDLADAIIEENKRLGKLLREEAEDQYGLSLGDEKKVEKLRKRAKETQKVFNDAKAAGEIASLKRLEEIARVANSAYLKADEEVEKIRQNIAKERLAKSKEIYDKQAKLVKDKEAQLAKLPEKQSGLFGLVVLSSSDRARIEKELEEDRQTLAMATARYETYRNAAETSIPVKPEDEGGAGKKGAKRPTFEIKPVNDLTNEIKKSALEAQKDLNDELLAGDKAGFTERQAAALDNFDVMGSLSDTQYFEDIEKANKYHDGMLDDLEDAIKKKSILDESQLTEEQFRADLEQNLRDQTLIAAQNHGKRLNDAQQKLVDEQIKIAQWALDKELDISDDLYNQQIIAAKEAYNNSKKTAEDKKALEEAMTRIAIEMANARIAIQIKELENQKKLYKDFPEKVAQIERTINDLKASVDTYDPSKDLQTNVEKLEKLLDYVAQGAQALSDFGSAIFDRRIEDINAEIEAEKNKYDTLIDLAKGNKDEQVRLQTEKDAKIKELEAKRLKEEQKKAKFEKANAILQIGINTAIGVSKAWAESPLTFGMPWSAVIAALGAIQIATVLAQPIPKYKGGLKNAKSDHVGMINDGGQREYIERDGNILSTSTKNAIVQLKKGDTVHKSYDDMVENSKMFNSLSRSIMLNSLYSKGLEVKLVGGDIDAAFDRNLKGLKGTIRDGFKNVTINNTTKVDMNWIAYKNNTL